jgi:hypothetical protein
VMPMPPMYEFEEEVGTRYNSVVDQKAAPGAAPGI